MYVTAVTASGTILDYTGVIKRDVLSQPKLTRVAPFSRRTLAMKTLNSVASKLALSAFAFAGLSALSATPAHADLYVSQIRTPSQQVGIPAGQQALQLQVVNTNWYPAVNQKVRATLQTWADGPTSSSFTVSSNSFNLPAYHSVWVNILLPAKAAGQNLVGQELKGYAYCGTHSYYL